MANDHNVTSYNVANEGCDCLTWHKDLSKRSSLEICTAVYIALKAHDQAGIAPPLQNKTKQLLFRLIAILDGVCLCSGWGKEEGRGGGGGGVEKSPAFTYLIGISNLVLRKDTKYHQDLT